MTEEDAKTKWCPFARTIEVHADGYTGTRNRVYVVEDMKLLSSLGGCQCIGSACMAWRWERPMMVFKDRHEGDEMVGTVEQTKPEPNSGYCGLAGRA